jgi:hypothetical protein
MYRDIVIFFENIPISPFSVTLSFLNRDPSLSKQSSRRGETLCVGPLNRSIGLEEDRWKAKRVW